MGAFFKEEIAWAAGLQSDRNCCILFHSDFGFNFCLYVFFGYKLLKVLFFSFLSSPFPPPPPLLLSSPSISHFLPPHFVPPLSLLSPPPVPPSSPSPLSLPPTVLRSLPSSALPPPTILVDGSTPLSIRRRVTCRHPPSSLTPVLTASVSSASVLAHTGEDILRPLSHAGSHAGSS